MIVGRLIPAGTGNMTTHYSDIAAKIDMERIAEREKSLENK